jgi:hypothetical protein
MLKRSWRALLLAGAAFLLMTGAAHAVDFTPGAPGLGDPFFPNAGNGGYDVSHYDLNFEYDVVIVVGSTNSSNSPALAIASTILVSAVALGTAPGAVMALETDLAGTTLGGVVTTPVINYPEVAIVGVNKIVTRPVVADGGWTPREMMNLSSSFDHRIVDGWDAAQFVPIRIDARHLALDHVLDRWRHPGGPRRSRWSARDRHDRRRRHPSES